MGMGWMGDEAGRMGMRMRMGMGREGKWSECDGWDVLRRACVRLWGGEREGAGCWGLRLVWFGGRGGEGEVRVRVRVRVR